MPLFNQLKQVVDLVDPKLNKTMEIPEDKPYLLIFYHFLAEPTKVGTNNDHTQRGVDIHNIFNWLCDYFSQGNMNDKNNKANKCGNDVRVEDNCSNLIDKYLLFSLFKDADPVTPQKNIIDH